MGFHDQYQDVGGGDWISADEKRVILEEGIPLTITAIDYDALNTFEGRPNPRYILRVLLPDPETGEDAERSIGFAAEGVPSRTRMISAMEAYLNENPDETIDVKLDKVGRSWILVSPDSDPTPTPAAASSRGTGTRSRRR